VLTGVQLQTTATGITYRVRPMRSWSDDGPFIFDACLRAVRCERPAKAWERADWESYRDRYLRPALQRSAVVVASDPEVLDQLYGYVAIELVDGRPVMHWAYVRALPYLRRQRIGTTLLRALVAEGPVWVSHRLVATWPWLSAAWRLHYGPHLVSGGTHEDLAGDTRQGDRGWIDQLALSGTAPRGHADQP